MNNELKKLLDCNKNINQELTAKIRERYALGGKVCDIIEDIVKFDYDGELDIFDVVEQIPPFFVNKIREELAERNYRSAKASSPWLKNNILDETAFGD